MSIGLILNIYVNNIQCRIFVTFFFSPSKLCHLYEENFFMEVFIVFYLLLISILHLNNILREYQHLSRHQSEEKTFICNASQM